MTWVFTGLAVGFAIGSFVSGRVFDAAGAEAGYGVPALSGAVAVTLGFLGYHRLGRPVPLRGRPHEHHSEREERHLA